MFLSISKFPKRAFALCPSPLRAGLSLVVGVSLLACVPTKRIPADKTGDDDSSEDSAESDSSGDSENGEESKEGSGDSKKKPKEDSSEENKNPSDSESESESDEKNSSSKDSSEEKDESSSSSSKSESESTSSSDSDSGTQPKDGPAGCEKIKWGDSVKVGSVVPRLDTPGYWDADGDNKIDEKETQVGMCQLHLTGKKCGVVIFGKEN